MIEDMVLFTIIACVGVLIVSFSGFGFALIMVPLLSLFFPPKEFLPSYHILAMVCMTVLALESRKHIEWRLLGRLLAMAVIAVPPGAATLNYLPTELISLAIAVLTMIFAILLLLSREFRIKKNIFAETLVGLCSGFLNGCTAMSGPPIVIYGLARQWDKDVFRSTLLVFFSAMSVMTLGWYFYMDILTIKAGVTAGVALLPSLAVSYIGIHLKNRVDEVIFRPVILIVIMGVGVMGMASYFMKATN